MSTRRSELTKAKNEATTDEEREAINKELIGLYEKYEQDWEKQKELGRMETLRYLEQEVRNYIRWARSQQGY